MAVTGCEGPKKFTMRSSIPHTSRLGWLGSFQFSAFPPLLTFSRTGSLLTESRDREAPVRPICVHLVGRTVVDLKGLERTSFSFRLTASRCPALSLRPIARLLTCRACILKHLVSNTQVISDLPRLQSKHTALGGGRKIQWQDF